VKDSAALIEPRDPGRSREKAFLVLPGLREPVLVSPREQDDVQSDGGSHSYDVWHDSLTVETEATEPWHLLVRRHLNLARDLSGRRVLEIGCGRGGFSCWLAGQTDPPPHIVAIDYSSVAVEKGRAHAAATGISGITWQTGDIQAIDQPEASFDTAISCETIEHVPDPPRAVRELARVLKPGGTLFLTTPNYFGPYGLYRAYLRLRGRRFTEVGQPINQFTMLPRTLLWLRRAGLIPTVVAGEGHYLLLPGREPRRIEWLDHKVFKWFATHGLIVARKPA
jgi:2-polyprenyl-3-methyl-5-hydroxy-6-metoxy-1,4-benzoquinol methylase